MQHEMQHELKKVPQIRYFLSGAYGARTRDLHAASVARSQLR